MAEARGRESWQHTSCMLAMIANVNRDPKKGRAFKPADFDPYAAGSSRRTSGYIAGRGGGGRIPITAENIGLLKDIFINRRR